MTAITASPPQSPPVAVIAKVSSRESESRNVQVTRQTRREANTQVDITIRETTTRTRETTEERRALEEERQKAATTRPTEQQAAETSKNATSQVTDTTQGITLGAAQNYLEAQKTANTSSGRSGSLLNRIV